MVARVVTIQAAGDRVGQVLGYYAGLAADQLDGGGGRARGPVDYYLDPNEPPGRWWGTGRPALGLAPGGPVLPKELVGCSRPATRPTTADWAGGSGTGRRGASTPRSRLPRACRFCGD